MSLPFTLTARPDGRWLLLLAGVLSLVFTVGCSQVGPRTGSSSPAAFDQQFIDMMVPHHQGAVEMAKIAQQRGEHPEITQMANAIIGAQEREISQMKQWRQAWFGSDQTPPMIRMPIVTGMQGHQMGSGSTMDMAADVEKLRQAGAPFDRAFIDAMIPHHQSAIDAAKAAEAQAQKPEIKELAKAIIADQQREIDQMRTWYQSWYGTSPSTSPVPPR